jgi:hypothetical protein
MCIAAGHVQCCRPHVHCCRPHVHLCAAPGPAVQLPIPLAHTSRVYHPHNLPHSVVRKSTVQGFALRCVPSCGVGKARLKCASCRLRCAAILRLVEGGANVNEVEAAGNTPLHNAAFEGWAEVRPPTAGPCCVDLPIIVDVCHTLRSSQTHALRLAGKALRSVPSRRLWRQAHQRLVHFLGAEGCSVALVVSATSLALACKCDSCDRACGDEFSSPGCWPHSMLTLRRARRAWGRMFAARGGPTGPSPAYLQDVQPQHCCAKCQHVADL